MAVIVVFSTFPDAEVAASIARTLVDEQLCACVNLVPAIRSIYRWQDATCDETEVLGVIKTTDDRLGALEARLVALHPYDVPEVIALPVAGGHAPYLAWVAGAR
ncbi:MAG TPA: divalent-cation tolerance protein CutA [Kofleriaceae bacterium]|jgi:periplasmic divalent cation tolerance protein